MFLHADAASTLIRLIVSFYFIKYPWYGMDARWVTDNNGTKSLVPTPQLAAVVAMSNSPTDMPLAFALGCQRWPGSIVPNGHNRAYTILASGHHVDTIRAWGHHLAW